MLPDNNGLMQNDFTISLRDLEKLNAEIERYKANVESIDEILFYDIQDVMKITGWSKKTVESLFLNSAFPCSDIGKRKLVLKTAFINFFSERRCKDNQAYWN